MISKLSCIYFTCLLKSNLINKKQTNKLVKMVTKSMQSILGLQPRDKAAMLVVNTKEIFLLNLHQNRVHFPAERNAFVLGHQHGRRDVTCKPAILSTFSKLFRAPTIAFTLVNKSRFAITSKQKLILKHF